MKSLQILPSLDVGGVERGVIDLARELRQRGEDLAVISSGGPLVAELDKLGVRHYTLPVHKKSLMSLRLIQPIADILRKECIDVVHARSRVPAWIAFFAARRAQVPFVTTCHGYYSTHFLSRVMGWGKRVIVISRIIGRHMIDDFGVSPERIRLVYRGIDMSHFKYFPDKYRTPKKTLRIVNVGRLSPIKGHMDFLKAVHELRRSVPHIEVWIVGSEGAGKTKYTQELQERIRQLSLQSCVQLVGKRRDIPEILAEADLLVLSTLVPEAFGRVVVEAGAVGTAVIATRVGGVMDIIDHEKNGILVEPGNAPAMCEAMSRLLKDRSLSGKYADALRRKVEENFTLDMMADKVCEVYREVKTERKILILKLGALGDIVLATPSFRMLRKRYPNAKISLLVDKKLAPMISACPYLDEVIPVERQRMSRPSYLLKLAKKLRREGYDISVDLQNSKWTHLLAYTSGVNKRYGFRRGKMGFLLNYPEALPKIPEEPVKNQFRILSRAGVKAFSDHLELWEDKDSERSIVERLTEVFRSQDGPLVGMVVGSSPKWVSKRWPREYFEEVSTRLGKELGCRVVLIGSSDDSELASGFPGEGEFLADMTGKTRPRELIALVRKLDVLISGDTAPLHIAAACDVRMVALFGPTDPQRHMPPGGKPTVFVRHMDCQPCYKGECHNPEKMACMKRISPRDVFEAVKRHLNSLQSQTAQ